MEKTWLIRSPSVICRRSPASAMDREMCAISRAMLSGLRMRSAKPVEMALRGMPSNFALSGACTMMSPFRSLMERIPFVPSEPVPDRMIATARFS